MAGFLWKNRVFCLTKPKSKAVEVSKYLDSLPLEGASRRDDCLSYRLFV